MLVWSYFIFHRWLMAISPKLASAHLELILFSLSSIHTVTKGRNWWRCHISNVITFQVFLPFQKESVVEISVYTNSFIQNDDSHMAQSIAYISSHWKIMWSLKRKETNWPRDLLEKKSKYFFINKKNAETQIKIEITRTRTRFYNWR